MADPYREMATVVQDPIAAEFDRIDAEKDKEAKKKLERVLKYMLVQYAKENTNSDGSWDLIDPGAHWWNFKKTIPSFEWDSTFGYLLDSRCEELQIVIGEKITIEGKILTWGFETDEKEEETTT